MTAIASSNSYSLGSFVSSETELPALLRNWLVASVRGPDSSPSLPAAADLASDEDWKDIQGSLNGDEDAFERLVRRYQQPIGEYMWRFTRDRGRWDELVHDVFVEAFLSLRRFQGTAPLLHWLKKIATRTGYRFWRRCQQQNRHIPLTPETIEAVFEDEDAISAYQAGELVHHLLARLAPRDRLVMTLMYLEACSVREIAELTGWSQSLVKVQAHRARRRLRQICNNMGIEP